MFKQIVKYVVPFVVLGLVTFAVGSCVKNLDSYSKKQNEKSLTFQCMNVYTQFNISVEEASKTCAVIAREYIHEGKKSHRDVLECLHELSTMRGSTFKQAEAICQKMNEKK
jgi:uncharacterized protein YutE (UPF0331/DUF86 family)